MYTNRHALEWQKPFTCHSLALRTTESSIHKNSSGVQTAEPSDHKNSSENRTAEPSVHKKNVCRSNGSTICSQKIVSRLNGWDICSQKIFICSIAVYVIRPWMAYTFRNRYACCFKRLICCAGQFSHGLSVHQEVKNCNAFLNSLSVHKLLHLPIIEWFICWPIATFVRSQTA